MHHELTVKTAGLPAKKTGTLVIYSGDGADLAGEAAAIFERTGLDWERVTGAAGFKGKPGQGIDIVAPQGIEADRLLVLGAGKSADGETAGLTAWADRGGSLMAKILATRAQKAAVVIEGADATPEAIAELAAGMRLRHYRFDKYRTLERKDDKNGEPGKLAVTLHVADKAAVDKALDKRLAVAEGTILARDLINEPANVLGPVEFAKIAESLSDYGVEVEILEPAEMRRLGMGSLLSVAAGAGRPARLAIMQWRGGKKSDRPVAFVGKGVCFDTGGISIKPAASMEDMKGDMGGAAAVTGLMKALAMRKARVNAVGVIGLVENMPDANATRPGDIVTAMNGVTIEVINTDAEGRLVLADALWYTQDRFKPQFMVNLATLTGAIVIGLGHDYAGMFSNDDALAGKLYQAGLNSGEKVWRMPLGAAYEKLIESKFADIKNTGGRAGGSITAAQFLQHFVNGVPWAHLDIAGTAFGAPATEISRGWAPGFGVALLNRLVEENYEG
ncbi:MAG TPA: leucyl aminopeptidase [Devosiaceae bacterium]